MLYTAANSVLVERRCSVWLTVSAYVQSMYCLQLFSRNISAQIELHSGNTKHLWQFLPERQPYDVFMDVIMGMIKQTHNDDASASN